MVSRKRLSRSFSIFSAVIVVAAAYAAWDALPTQADGSKSGPAPKATKLPAWIVGTIKMPVDEKVGRASEITLFYDYRCLLGQAQVRTSTQDDAKDSDFQDSARSQIKMANELCAKEKPAGDSEGYEPAHFERLVVEEVMGQKEPRRRLVSYPFEVKCSGEGSVKFDDSAYPEVAADKTKPVDVAATNYCAKSALESAEACEKLLLTNQGQPLLSDFVQQCLSKRLDSCKKFLAGEGDQAESKDPAQEKKCNEANVMQLVVLNGEYAKSEFQKCGNLPYIHALARASRIEIDREQDEKRKAALLKTKELLEKAESFAQTDCPAAAATKDSDKGAAPSEPKPDESKPKAEGAK